MKQLLIVIICLLSFRLALSPNLRELRYRDLQTPASWHRQASQNSIQISTEDKTNGTYCLITLFKSLPGNNSRKIFDAAGDGC
jgi:hypothetical protein